MNNRRNDSYLDQVNTSLQDLNMTQKEFDKKYAADGRLYVELRNAQSARDFVNLAKRCKYRMLPDRDTIGCTQTILEDRYYEEGWLRSEHGDAHAVAICYRTGKKGAKRSCRLTNEDGKESRLPYWADCYIFETQTEKKTIIENAMNKYRNHCNITTLCYVIKQGIPCWEHNCDHWTEDKKCR